MIVVIQKLLKFFIRFILVRKSLLHSFEILPFLVKPLVRFFTHFHNLKYYRGNQLFAVERQRRYDS